MKNRQCLQCDTALEESHHYPHDRCYQALKKTAFRFDRNDLYSYGSLQRITGIDGDAFHSLADRDRWPHAKVYHPPGIGKRTLLVKGSFLADVQERLRSERLIAYYSVPEDAVGVAGLGLERQKKSVTDYLDEHGGTVIASFMEVPIDDEPDPLLRYPEWRDAVSIAMRQRAVLLITNEAELSREAEGLLGVSGVIYRWIGSEDCERSTEVSFDA